MGWKDKMKILFAGGGLFTFVVMVYLQDIPDSYESYFKTHHSLGRTKFDVHGVVKEKYLDSLNHYYPVFKLKDSNDYVFRFYFSTTKSRFYDFIEVGDTVISEKNSLKATVKNKGKNKLFDLF
jgi:hypothetical protein